MRDERKSESRKITKFQNFLLSNLGFGKVAVTNEVSNNKRINLVGFVRTDTSRIAPRICLNGIYDVNDEIIFYKERVQSEPVVPGSLNADFKFGIRCELFQKPFSVVSCILELEALKDNFFLVVDKRSDVKTFIDVDAQIEHFYHLKKIFRTEFLLPINATALLQIRRLGNIQLIRSQFKSKKGQFIKYDTFYCSDGAEIF